MYIRTIIFFLLCGSILLNSHATNINQSFQEANDLIIAGNFKAAKKILLDLEDLNPNNLSMLNVDELKNYLKEELRNAYDLKEAQIEAANPGMMREAERFFILQQLDTLWREHLQSMDSLRESVGLRGYGQKDPLIEYKNEGYDMFLEMMINMRRNVIYSMFMFQPAKKSS